MIFPIFNCKQERAFRSCFSVSRSRQDVSALFQILDRTPDCGLGHGQILGDPSLGRPALSLRVRSLRQVQIQGYSAARQMVAVNAFKPAHPVCPSSCFFGAVRIGLCGFTIGISNGTLPGGISFPGSFSCSFGLGGYRFRIASIKVSLLAYRIVLLSRKGAS